MCSARKKHFLAIPRCFCSSSGAGGGCVFPWDLAWGPPAAPGASSQGLALPGLPGLCPLAGSSSVEVDASAPPSPWVRALHSRGWNVPRVRLPVFYSSAFLSLSATVESLDSLLPVAFRPYRLSGRSDPRPPGLAWGAPSRPFGPGLHRFPRPCPLSPGRPGSRRPRRCPSGPATLQT